jgi:hypothetical protein
MARLKDLAQVIKSKNAGPYQLTIDVVFEDREVFRKVKESGVLNPELFARLYKTDPADVIFTVYDPGNAIKATVPRQVPAGDLGDSDVYGAQQHGPLLNVEVRI